VRAVVHHGQCVGLVSKDLSFLWREDVGLFHDVRQVGGVWAGLLENSPGEVVVKVKNNTGSSHLELL
jgi:hypothetical protein